MRTYCGHEEIDLEILTNLHVPSFRDYEKLASGTPYVRACEMYILACASVISELFEGSYSHLLF
jgi:hypothetical protein